jgi:hypothetical protein
VFTGGQIDLLNVDSEFLCKFLRCLAALGRLLDCTDSLIGESYLVENGFNKRQGLGNV